MTIHVISPSLPAAALAAAKHFMLNPDDHLVIFSQASSPDFHTIDAASIESDPAIPPVFASMVVFSGTKAVLDTLVITTLAVAGA